MTFRRTLPLLLLPALLVAGPALAQGVLDRVEIHGFGGWAVGQSDEGEYLGASEDREYDDRSFALNVTGKPADRLTISAQMFWGRDTGDDENLTASLDYAFADWHLTDDVALRAGIVKQPFGLYNEIYEVGTVRPFFDLPRSVYGPFEIVGKAYQGLGLTGRYRLGNGDWEIHYDLYGGEINLASYQLGFDVAGADELVEAVDEKLKDLVGGRVVVSTPVSGLNVGVSAYTGEPDLEAEEEAESLIPIERQSAYAGHVEYLDDAWSLRSEAVHREGGDDGTTLDSLYLEAARRLGAHWQVAARWERADIDVDPGDRVPYTADGKLEDAVLGVNYWFNPNLVLKLAYHQPEIVVDVHFTNPAFEPPTGEGLALNTPDELLKLGVQFSF